MTSKHNNTEASRIHKRLQVLGCSWPEMGEALHVSEQNLYHWRQRGVPKHRVAHVASFLSCSVDWLITGRQPRSTAPLIKPRAASSKKMRPVDPSTAPDEAIRIQDLLDGMDQCWKDLGHTLNATDQNIYYWRKNGVPKSLLVTISKSLGCSISWLLTGTTIPVSRATQITPDLTTKVHSHHQSPGFIAQLPVRTSTMSAAAHA